MTLHHRIEGAGDAPVLLMGSSLGTTLEMWDDQLPLASAFRIVRFDHRGHGRSPAPAGPYELADLAGDVLALMDRAGVQHASYCGLSLGGMIGMWLAANQPDRIDRLVLICTAAYMPPASAWQERAAAVLEAGSTEPIADGVVERWLTPGFAAQHPQVQARLRAMLLGCAPDGYAWCCGAIERMDLRAALSAIRAPTLVISGADDVATPPEKQQQIAAAVPGARHEVLAPAAHIAAVEQAGAVNHLIREHLS
ncbi:MAG: 3-oxoadipate enol-lactonase [Solirubrobacteraceae bacterium]